ncbi:hypothetical protein SCHPADRAFT_944955 [Schizopora paradoxa]|uniref:Uncharacterized protein n=1 Tax=Schizopora paradoxa TaxID=27342 RepID=A0A0H2R8X1_9AGAM|nr:hypothetical protein SCHPADRAFT_944955 [Schizopora paradoxa]
MDVLPSATYPLRMPLPSRLAVCWPDMLESYHSLLSHPRGTLRIYPHSLPRHQRQYPLCCDPLIPHVETRTLLRSAARQALHLPRAASGASHKLPPTLVFHPKPIDVVDPSCTPLCFDPGG